MEFFSDSVCNLLILFGHDEQLNRLFGTSQIQVYDITVDETSNFALTNGIFVHNSKDLADAVCGSVMNVLESDEITNVRRSSDLFNVINAEKHQTYSNRDDLLKSVESALLSNH